MKLYFNDNLYKISQYKFADKNEKGKKENKENKENKEKGKEQKVDGKNKNENNNKNQKANPNKESEQKKDMIKQDISNNLPKEGEESDMEFDIKDIKMAEKEIDEDKELSQEEKKEMKELLGTFTEKDQEIGEAKFMNYFFKSQKKILGMPVENEIDEDKKDFESTTISHDYEKEFGAVSITEKNYIEKVTKEFLKDYNIDAKEAEFLKERRKDILSYALFDRIRDIKSLKEVNQYIATYTDYKNYDYTLSRFDRLVQVYRELRDNQNPAYIQLRSMDRLLKDEEKRLPKDRNIDTRQNANSDNYLKIQPRMKIDYAYNIEQNKEFYFTFDKIFQEDQKRLIEKMKLVKYIKTHPNKYGVKNRWIAKHFNVPIEKLPDYDVDITGFEPQPTKRAKRNYEKRMADDISNYEAWRVFDRLPTFYNEDDHHYNIELIPLNLFNVINYYLN